jgi:ATP-binding cassette, sub-family E, member 1
MPLLLRYCYYSAYGVVTMPFSVREGINIFLAGFVPTENLRFRDSSLDFKMTMTAEEYVQSDSTAMYNYPAMTKTMKSPNGAQFKLHVEPGTFTDSEILVRVNVYALI